MTHQFLVTADISSAEDADFIAEEIEHVPGVLNATLLTFSRNDSLTRAIEQVAVARASENQDRMLNALTYALNVACGLVPGMYSP